MPPCEQPRTDLLSRSPGACLALALWLALVACGCGEPANGFLDVVGRDAARQDADAAAGLDAETRDVASNVDVPAALEDAAGDAGAMCTGGGTDPYPTLTTPGEYTDPLGCMAPTCPSPIDGFSATPNAESSVAEVRGHVSGAGSCRFVVVNSQCGVEEGTLGLEPDTGNFVGSVPLFCGTNLVRIVCSAGTNRRIRVLTLPGRMCDGDDLRLTLTWDDAVRDGELHLIRAPNHINDAANDCTWTTCIPPRVLDWGTAGDPTDDPIKDVDNVVTAGTEHITLTRAPPGLYYVLSEHWNPGGAPGSMSVQINVRGRAPTVRTLASITAHWVWYVGTIEFPGGVFTPSDAMGAGHTPVLTDCTGAWTFPGCGLPIPQ